MKTLFVAAGVVVGHGTASRTGAVISSAQPDTATYEVDDSHPADTGWLCEVTDGVPVFTAPPAPLPDLTPMQFYLAFTPAERIAIKTSTNPMVEEFWATYQLAVTTQSAIHMSLTSNQQAIGYLATPAPHGPGILAPERVPQVLQGVAQ